MLSDIRAWSRHEVVVVGRGGRFEARGIVNFETLQGVFQASDPYTEVGIVPFVDTIVFRVYFHPSWPGDVLGFLGTATPISFAGPTVLHNLTQFGPKGDFDSVQGATTTPPVFIVRFRRLTPNSDYNFSLAVISPAVSKKKKKKKEKKEKEKNE